MRISCSGKGFLLRFYVRGDNFKEIDVADYAVLIVDHGQFVDCFFNHNFYSLVNGRVGLDKTRLRIHYILHILRTDKPDEAWQPLVVRGRALMSLQRGIPGPN